MPINWNSETDAKLFLGDLAQLKGLKMKLDYEALAAYMGPDCTPCAIGNRIVRLRHKAESVDLSTTPKTTPSSSPRKRKAASTPKTPIKKNTDKVKDKAVEEYDSETEMEEKPLKIEIKDEAEEA